MAGQYWRYAGITYLEYINLSGFHIRNALKDQFKAAAKTRENIQSVYTSFQNGKEAGSTTLSLEEITKIGKK